MLERLARWLRVLGYDTISARLSGPGSEAVTTQAAVEGRMILTRRHALREADLPGDTLRIRAGSPMAQLSQVLVDLGLEGPWRLFTRCLVCNSPLLPVGPVAGLAAAQRPSVPARKCPTCGREYWDGVHTRRMRAALRRGLGPRFVEVVSHGQ